MTFELNEAEIAKAKEFQKKMVKKHGSTSNYEYCFTPIGIGIVVEVCHKDTAISLDITDYSSW